MLRWKSCTELIYASDAVRDSDQAVEEDRERKEAREWDPVVSRSMRKEDQQKADQQSEGDSCPEYTLWETRLHKRLQYTAG
jgi:hypothetical protein